MAAIANIRVIRRKIRAVGNIKKITRAMQMVSAAKLRKVQERLMSIRPYADKISELLQGLAGNVRDMNHPLFTPRAEVKKVAYVVFMADKGLCGSYNSNMGRFAQKTIQERALPFTVTAFGIKSVDFFTRRGDTIRASHTQLPTEVPFVEVQKIVRKLVDLFQSGEADEVQLLFTRYVNAMTFRPGSVRFLPIEPPKVEEGKPVAAREYIFEPEPAKIMDRLVPRYLEVTFHRLLLESFSSEHAARMNAMQNATKSAQELIDSLTLTYNKARQSGITKELLDIVGGAEALKG